MDVVMGSIVRHRQTERMYIVHRIHPYMREIELKPISDTYWDFEWQPDNFVDIIDDYEIQTNDNTFVDIEGLRITTEDYIVV